MDRSLSRIGVFAVAMAISLSAASSVASEGELKTQFDALHAQLDASTFKHPLLLQSSDTTNGRKGDVYAIVDKPIQVVSDALKDSAHWCEALLLHVNNRQCEVTKKPDGETITLKVVRKHDQPVAAAFSVPFDFRLVDSTPRHLEVGMSSTSGPLGTSNYRITLEAVPINQERSFLHFSYAYEENFLARTATEAYLSIFGSTKVGFTVVGKTPDGKPDYIKGTRGLVERNAMRYFLAIDAYLAAPSEPQTRWNAWYSATELYPHQLHEMDRATYLAAKLEDTRTLPPK
nr:hypothetical protein [Rhodoferax sp.]